MVGKNNGTNTVKHCLLNYLVFIVNQSTAFAMQTRREVLEKVLASVEKFKAEFPSPHQLPPHPANPIIPTAPLRLAEFTSDFNSEMLHKGFMAEIRETTALKATQLSNFYQDSYLRTSQRLLAFPDPNLQILLGNLRRTFENLFENHDLPKFMAQASKAQAIYDACNPSKDRKRLAFNSVS